MHFTFVITPEDDKYNKDENKGTESIDRSGGMYIYINGIGASAAEYAGYNETSQVNQFSHDKEIFFNSDDCTVNLFGFRMYYSYLEPDKILNNWITDMNPSNKIEAYVANAVYSE
jgi:hypothetical protein